MMEPDKCKNFIKSPCFFCLQNTTCKNPDEITNFSQLSLRNLTRFLQLIHPDCRNKFSDLKIERELEMSQSGYWYICDNCSQLALEFNELYDLMENIKLRLNWCLDRIQGVMTLADSTSNENELRTALIGRIKGRIPAPRVVLKKIDDDFDQKGSKVPMDSKCHPESATQSKQLTFNTESNCSNDFTGPDEFEVSDPSTPKPSVEELNLGIKMECDADATPISDNFTHEQVQVHHVKTEKVNDQFILKCSYCRAQFEGPNCTVVTKAGAEKRLREHIAHYHCETLFPNHKLDHVTDDQFKRILVELLFKDLISEDESPACTFCKKKFKPPSHPRMKVLFHARMKKHLIADHYDKLVEKLQNIQSNPDLSRILIECNPNGEICKCGSYLQKSANKAKHNMWHCPLTITVTQVTPRTSPPLPRKTPPVVSRPLKSQKLKLIECKGCKKFFNQANVSRHWKYSCAKGKRLPHPRGDTLACEHCNYKCNYSATNNKFRMKMHLVKYHLEHFFLQEKGILPSECTEERLKEILVGSLFPKFIRINEKLTSCSICGQNYLPKSMKNSNVNDVLVKMHLITHHLDDLKESLKALLVNETQLEQFVRGSHNHHECK